MKMEPQNRKCAARASSVPVVDLQPQSNGYACSEDKITAQPKKENVSNIFKFTVFQKEEVIFCLVYCFKS